MRSLFLHIILAFLALGMQGQQMQTKSVGECEPGWEEVPNLQYNMQVIAQIVIDDEVALNPNVVLGAFFEGECRGIASPMPEFDGLIFLTVGANTPQGEPITLKIWDPNLCDSCNAVQSFTFMNQQLLGSLDNPYTVYCSNEVELTLNFNQGYTWFSLNIEQSDMHPDAILAELEPCYNDRIIGQQQFTVYSGTQWVGNLTSLNPTKMYRMRLCSSQTLEFNTFHAPNTPIHLPAGSTWIGYRPSDCLSVNAALANLSPAPSYNDRIIGQHAFALYNGSQWVGSLTQMCPGKGYVIKVANTSTLVYPAGRKNASVDGTFANLIYESPLGNPPLNKQHNMMLVAAIHDKGVYSFGENDLLYAFIDNEIRGVAPMHENVFFMTIGEDTEIEKEVRFKLWMSESNKMVELNEHMTFSPMGEAGELYDPFVFTIGNEIHAQKPLQLFGPFPNPAAIGTTIRFWIDAAAEVELKIFNSYGQQVLAKQQKHTKGGLKNMVIDLTNLLPGFYSFIMVTADGQKSSGKLIVTR